MEARKAVHLAASGGASVHDTGFSHRWPLSCPLLPEGEDMKGKTKGKTEGKAQSLGGDRDHLPDLRIPKAGQNCLHDYFVINIKATLSLGARGIPPLSTCP